MKIGTKSLLFGVHQVFLHPLFVFWGWCKLYVFPNWKEFICIIIHDWGYWGCGDMDGEEGANHPIYGAYLATKYLHWVWSAKRLIEAKQGYGLEYHNLCILHSANFANKKKEIPSKLCWADKLATVLMPCFLWVLLSKITGEFEEYSNNPDHIGNGTKNPFVYYRLMSKTIIKRIGRVIK